MARIPNIKTFLWFAGGASEAAHFYVDIFPGSRIVSEVRGAVDSTVPAGDVLVVDFELSGKPFVGLNGGTQFAFNESVSFVVQCDDQEEIDYYWSRLTADGGQPSQCGWLKDKFGVSWQVTPKDIGRLIATPAGMKAMMQMRKLDIATLEAANR